jgi:hypothetical protein
MAKLNPADIEDIRFQFKEEQIREKISDIVEELASQYKISKSTIYRITKDLRANRKRRTDCGNRKMNLETDQNLGIALGYRSRYNCSTPRTFYKMNQLGIDLPISSNTFNRYERELKLDRKHKNLTPCCRFEAKAPGAIFQFDISGVKERWFDVKTRKIKKISPLNISKNHPNTNKDLLPVWRFVLTDDFSRLTFVRYYACKKPTGKEVVDFLLYAYSKIGVPKILYTDNDSVIKYGSCARFTRILNKAVQAKGHQYQVLHHLPGNARATGKVEARHKVIEDYEKDLGWALDQKIPIDLEYFNTTVAEGFAEYYNNRINYATGESPVDRWHKTLSTLYKTNYEELRSYCLADEGVVKIRGDLGFSFKGKKYQLPTSSQYGFSKFIGNKLQVIFPYQRNTYLLAVSEEETVCIGKELQEPIEAGNYNQIATPDNIRLRDRLEEKVMETARSHAPDPKVHAKKSSSKISRFPKPEKIIDKNCLPEIPEIPTPPKEQPYIDLPAVELPISWYRAVTTYKDQFGSISDCKTFMDWIFESRGSQADQILIENLISEFLEKNKETSNNKGVLYHVS